MKRTAVVVLATAAVVAAAGTGIGLAASSGGSASQRTNAALSSTVTAPDASAQNDYYQRVITPMLRMGSMMGGSGYGYGWMMGGPAAPGWTAGGSLPSSMMGGATDPGAVMGRLFADAPGPRISADEAARLGDLVPAGASVDQTSNRLAFTTSDVAFTIVAGSSTVGESYRVAGLVNPTIVVPSGARVSIRLVNADPDSAHGLVITVRQAAVSRMPMMTAPPAFPGAAQWFLGEPTAAGLHVGTLRFTATTSGAYQYLCPIPDHAHEGMIGTLLVHG